MTGELKKVADITTDKLSATYTLRTMAVDADGNFYAVNNATSVASNLYQWTASDIKDGVLELTGEKLESKGVYVTSYASMTYDQAHDKLYLGSGYGLTTSFGSSIRKPKRR